MKKGIRKKGHYSRNPIILISELLTFKNGRKGEIDEPVLSSDEEKNDSNDACIFCNT